MGKLLRVLVIIIFLLSAGALALGWMLFAKRELLKGRTQKLEKAVIALGSTVEQEPATLDSPPAYPARDVSPTSSEILSSPERSDFWDTYKAQLELQNQLTMEVKNDRELLKTYYLKDPITGKKKRDGNGYPIISGEGTMQGLLDDIIDRSGQQLARLNETRQQLTDIRNELIDTIGEINGKKSELRQAYKKIDELNAEIDRLNGEIRDLKDTVADLEQQKRILEDQLAEQRAEVARLTEENKEQALEIERIGRDLADALGRLTGGDGTEGIVRPESTGRQVSVLPGVKGRVVGVNPAWNFVIVELNDEFVNELMGDDPEAGVPQIHVMIRRHGTQEFVTKIRLLQLRENNFGVADNITSWQQMPIQEGDEVFAD